MSVNRIYSGQSHNFRFLEGFWYVRTQIKIIPEVSQFAEIDQLVYFRGKNRSVTDRIVSRDPVGFFAHIFLEIDHHCLPDRPSDSNAAVFSLHPISKIIYLCKL